MAGGVGSRFWPASTPDFPKQFLPFFGTKSLLQQTIDRIEPLVPVKNVFIVTNERYKSIILEQVPEMPQENILCEPQAKNTAPCVLLATRRILLDDAEASMAVLPADHYITQPEAFRSVLQAAFEHAEQSETLTTVGIQPNRPETGYGYIQFDAASKQAIGKEAVMKVEAFKEKPDEATAQQFLDAGNFLWNSGMFIWSAKVINKAFGSYAQALSALADQYLTSTQDFEVGANGMVRFFDEADSISIDYAIMEKAKQVSVLPGDFGWNDVGSWQAVYDLEEKDAQQNATNVELEAIDATSNLVRLSSGKKVALLGVEGLSVVETDGVLMIARLDRSQDVKKLGK